MSVTVFFNKSWCTDISDDIGDKVCMAGYKDPSTEPPCVTPRQLCSSHSSDSCENNGTMYWQSDGTCVCLCAPGYTG